MRENWVRFQGWKDLLEEKPATHSTILAWRIPWTIRILLSDSLFHLLRGKEAAEGCWDDFETNSLCLEGCSICALIYMQKYIKYTEWRVNAFSCPLDWSPHLTPIPQTTCPAFSYWRKRWWVASARQVAWEGPVRWGLCFGGEKLAENFHKYKTF